MASHLSSTCRFVYLHFHNVSRCSCRPLCCSVRRAQQDSAVTEKKQHTDVVEKIVIPRRKKRDSLSILKALSSTVGKDFTAAHNRYLDDPFLMPATFKEKQLYSLSRSSGRKAARYFVENYQFLFEHSDAVPKIQAYQPPSATYQHSDPTEDALLERIGMRRVKDAIAVYKTLRQTGEKLSLETQLKLLDLLVIFNCEDPSPVLHPEELIYTRDSGPPKGRIANTWDKKSIAEEVFQDLPEKTPDAYNSMVRGMAKYLDVDGAFRMHKEMVEKDIPVHRETYHSLIPLVPYYFKMKWEMMEKILTEMKERNLRPNLETFNSILLGLSRIASSHKSKDNALKTLVEMQNCGIEPCLGTWLHVIRLFYFFEDNSSNILHNIISDLEGKELTVQDPHDLQFFSFAMMKCFTNLKDLELAYRIDALLHTGNNIYFLGGSFSEQSYSWNFMQLLFMFETLDKIMEYYEKLVPSIWTPAPNGILELLKAVELHDGYEYLPRIWSDVVLFDFFRVASFTDPFFSLMTKKNQPAELQNKFADMAEHLIDRWKQERENDYFHPVEINAKTIGDIILIFLRADRFQKAWATFQTYKVHNRKFSGILSENSLVALTDICIEQNRNEQAIECLSLISDLDFGCHKELAEKIRTKMELTESEKQHVDVLM